MIGEHAPTVIMVVGVNGAGKTTSVGKLTRHLATPSRRCCWPRPTPSAPRRASSCSSGPNAPGATARPAERVEIVSQEGGDPAGVTFDAVIAGQRARLRRGDRRHRRPPADAAAPDGRAEEDPGASIAKAEPGAPHEVLLVIDGNTGQNALAQVQAFDDALELTGLIVTKLDGTAKGGVLAAIALWSRTRAAPMPVYFIGVGEKLEDLQTFRAREFAQALLELSVSARSALLRRRQLRPRPSPRARRTRSRPLGSRTSITSPWVQSRSVSANGSSAGAATAAGVDAAPRPDDRGAARSAAAG